MVLHMPDSCKWEISEDITKTVFSGTGVFKSIVNFAVKKQQIEVHPSRTHLALKFLFPSCESVAY